MARRKQKFSLLHILIMAALLIWLPSIIERMAGIPPETTDSETASPEMSEQESTTPVETASSTESESAQENRPQLVKPAPQSLHLQETLLSNSGKTAIINGRAFGEQQMITPLGYPYRIRTISAGRVILEGDGGLYELRRQVFR